MSFKPIKVTVVGADNLAKRNFFSLPDPFVVLTIDGEQTQTTEVCKATLYPYWNQNFIFNARPESILAVQVFDKKKWMNKSDQGFLGVLNLRIGDIIDMRVISEWVVNQDLKRANNYKPISGSIVLHIATLPAQPGGLAVQPPSDNSGFLTPDRANPSLSQRTSSRSPSITSANSAVIQSNLEAMNQLNLGSPIPSPSSSPARTAASSSDRPPSMSSQPSTSSLEGSFDPHSDQYGPFPPGWERRMTSQGRVYYLDHNHRRTSWHRPPILPSQNTGSSIASGANGRPQTVQPRQRPQTAGLLEPDSAVTASALARRLSVNSAASGAGPSSSTSAQSPQLSRNISRADTRPLPSGWEQRVTAEGRIYYVDHNTRTTSWHDPRQNPNYQPPSRTTNASRTLTQAEIARQVQLLLTSSVEKLGPLPSNWEMRMTANGRVYFVDHSSKITTWDDPRLPSSVDDSVPQYRRDFQRKLFYFRSQPQLRSQPGEFSFDVSRSTIFSDSFAALMSADVDQLKKRLKIKFRGEEGLDYGGLSREFFLLLSKEIFKPEYCLFKYSAHDNYTLQINPNSGINPDHLQYFKFVGRTIGLAIFHQRFLDCFFVSSFHKMLLGKPVGLNDLEGIDDEMYRNTVWMLDNDVEGVIFENFTVVEDVFGQKKTVELVPNGSNINVDNSNKAEYVEAKVQYWIAKRTQRQMESICEGLYEIIPPNLLAVFDEKEVELLIGGISEVDIDDWKKYTTYRGYEVTDQPVQLFWTAVQGWDNEKRNRLLQFVTGTSRIPINGFKGLMGSDGPRQFTIERLGKPEDLPKAHTCFNRLDLPPYGSLEKLEKKLTLAIEETFGFGNE